MHNKIKVNNSINLITMNILIKEKPDLDSAGGH